MTRLLPQPGVSVAIMVTWLLAQNGARAADVLVGAIFAVLIPLFSARFWPDYPRRIGYAALLRLSARFAFDVLVANVRVAVLVLGPARRPRPAFLVVPLDVESDHAITLLASIISLTPGTVSANVSGDRRTLLVHALAVTDPVSEVARIKLRYESLVKEALKC